MNLSLYTGTKTDRNVKVIDDDTGKLVATSPDCFAALEYIAREEIKHEVKNPKTQVAGAQYCDADKLKQLFNIS